jgi:hypothetical protein
LELRSSWYFSTSSSLSPCCSIVSLEVSSSIVGRALQNPSAQSHSPGLAADEPTWSNERVPCWACPRLLFSLLSLKLLLLLSLLRLLALLMLICGRTGIINLPRSLVRPTLAVPNPRSLADLAPGP